MLKKNRKLMMLGSTSILLLGLFQNCAKTSFSGSTSEQSAATSQSSSSGTISSSSGGVTSSGEPGDDSQCSAKLQSLPGGAGSAIPSIVYDSLPATGTSVSYSNFMSLPAINSASVPLISDGVSTSVNVTASSVGQMQNLAAKQILINSKSLSSLTDFAAETTTIVTHSLGDVGLFATGILCVSAQSVSSMHGMSGASSFWGRNENSQLATIGSLGELSAFVNFHYFNITKISNVSLNMRLSNSHLGSLQGASGVLYLKDSVVDTVQNFAGIIHLKGSSSITTLKDNATIVIHD